MSAKSSPNASRIRQPAVAGMFYPDEKPQLRRMVNDYLDQAPVKLDHVPKAIIAPHAGYSYSGPIAGTAFFPLARARNVTRVVLLGPSHRVAFDGLAAPRATGFETPLGVVSVDTATVERARSLPQVQEFDAAHTQEHSLEVELPFLQLTLKEFALVPLVVGDASDEAVGEVIDLLWGGPETLFVISSDLSHYLDYHTARELDRRTADAIEQLQPECVGFDQACGRVPIRGFLWAAKKRGLPARTLDLRNSGDTSGRRDRVVGYGAFAFGSA